MRMYNFRIKQVDHKSIIGYGKIFSGEMFRIFNNESKRLMTLQFDYKPSKNRIKRAISKNLYSLASLPF